MQLSLFPISVYLQRIRAEHNEWRYYAMSIQPDLFGGALLMRRWGRIGTAGRLRLDQFPDEGAAANALAHHARQKLRRGYRVIAQNAPLFS
ncbi:MAG: WGR domain-containing protein [Acetobacter syzygii]|uniref:WGR domain-containing protein n=1 Tax=Acetobacter syzygii TaxID=146476 RepID=UPI0039EAEB02